MTAKVVPARALREGDVRGDHPLLAVWEVTLHCDQPCLHCGSRAGRPRTDELATDEMLEIADALARIGCREVSLIGGEAYLRSDLTQIVERLKSHGAHVTMQTGGRGLTQARIEELAAAGLAALGVSLDGDRATHDKIRGNVGSYDAAIEALDRGYAAGLTVAANTQVNRLTFRMLDRVAKEVYAHGVRQWQLALTVPMGRAAEQPDMLLEPRHVVDAIETLGVIQLQYAKESRYFDIQLSNNLGYYGPYENLLRSRQLGSETHWYGCEAGVHSIALESDGTVKGCPSLPTASYSGGNVRDTSLEDIWRHSEELSFVRRRSVEELWGYCRECYYADVCHAGCNWMTHSLFGRRGNNPYCYHRVLEMQKRGVREELVQRERAPGQPFDHGRFEIVEVPWDAPPTEPAQPSGKQRRLPLL